jgi:hypothetical protein
MIHSQTVGNHLKLSSLPELKEVKQARFREILYSKQKDFKFKSTMPLFLHKFCPSVLRAELFQSNSNIPPSARNYKNPLSMKTPQNPSATLTPMMNYNSYHINSSLSMGSIQSPSKLGRFDKLNHERTSRNVMQNNQKIASLSLDPESSLFKKGNEDTQLLTSRFSPMLSPYFKNELKSIRKFKYQFRGNSFDRRIVKAISPSPVSLIEEKQNLNLLHNFKKRAEFGKKVREDNYNYHLQCLKNIKKKKQHPSHSNSEKVIPAPSAIFASLAPMKTQESPIPSPKKIQKRKKKKLNMTKLMNFNLKGKFFDSHEALERLNEFDIKFSTFKKMRKRKEVEFRLPNIQ